MASGACCTLAAPDSPARVTETSRVRYCERFAIRYTRCSNGDGARGFSKLADVIHELRLMARDRSLWECRPAARDWLGDDAATGRAEVPRHARTWRPRLRGRPAARLRRRPHLGHRQHHPQAAPGGEETPGRWILLLAWPFDGRLPDRSGA